MERLKVGDDVVVIRGNDKGKRGRISRVVTQKDAVVIEGVNMVKRHIRATPQRPGGILEVEAPIHSSKVMLVDPESGKRTRIRHQMDGDNKTRISAKGGGEITPSQD